MGDEWEKLGKKSLACGRISHHLNNIIRKGSGLKYTVKKNVGRSSKVYSCIFTVTL